MVHDHARAVLVLAPGAVRAHILREPERESTAHRPASCAPFHREPRQVEWQVEASDQRAAAVGPRKEDPAEKLRTAQVAPTYSFRVEAVQLRVLSERRVARGVALG